MNRIILTLTLIGTLAAATAPAFALNQMPNCSSQNDFARCVIEQSQDGQ